MLKHSILAYLLFFVISLAAQETVKSRERKNSILFNYSNLYWDRIKLSEAPHVEPFTGNYIRSKNFGLTYKRLINDNWEHQFHANFGVFPTYLAVSFRQRDFYPYFPNSFASSGAATPMEFYRENYFLNFGYAIGRKVKLNRYFELIPSIGLSLNRYFINYSQVLFLFPDINNTGTTPIVSILQSDPHIPMGFNYQIPFRFDLQFNWKRIILGAGFMYQYGIGEFVETRRAVVILPDTPLETRLSSSRKNNFYGLRFFIGFQ